MFSDVEKLAANTDIDESIWRWFLLSLDSTGAYQAYLGNSHKASLFPSLTSVFLLPEGSLGV